MTETLSAALPEDVEAAVHRVLKAACERELRLATAESCTGGLIASVLTDVEGVSHVFERGFVVYTDEAKAEILGVPADLIEREGAVSRDVAVAMAEGGIAHSGADICLAVTGFSGPGGPGDEPGLVHFACLRRGGSPQHREEHFGDIGRGETRIACVRTALDMIGACLG
ncbi:CinA family protein [Sphingomonas gilva]|uniref:CinA family protein n=1 Tax=Sphingomonas gilva TaxID=2305907 RepID=A0A396RVN2_9SPHN|nr:nicotinamide-nucleotide amidohydrolase family protein [Sphingomonas gilva]RHW18523.1 CinA family protein [Sphingomonas gilva]